MKKRLLIVLVALGAVVALLIGLSLRRDRASFAPHSFRLANGLEAEVVTGDCGANAALVVVFPVGANQDPIGHSGMVNVIEKLLAAQGLRVETSSDFTRFSIVAPHEKILDEVDALAKKLAQPGFTETALIAAKEQVLADIKKRLGTDATLTAVTDASESVLPSAGRGRRGGVAAEVESIDLAAVSEFWKTQFTAGNTRLVLLGKVNPEKAKPRIEQAFGKLPTGTPATTRAPGDMTVTGTLVMGDAPAAVATAVRAPPPTDHAFPAFLVLAARLMKEGSGANEWTAHYDPVTQPELLVITGSIKPGEPAEPGAARIRKSVDAVLARPLAPSDVAAAHEKFGVFLGLHDHDTAACSQDPLRLALALARRPMLGVAPASLAQGIDGLTAAQLAEGVAFFAPNRTTSVIAGGVNR